MNNDTFTGTLFPLLCVCDYFDGWKGVMLICVGDYFREETSTNREIKNNCRVTKTTGSFLMKNTLSYMRLGEQDCKADNCHN